MKARGSAIIIAMLMIASIAGIAFAIGRLLFIESASASYYANGSIAYYAAESGMEEGFLRYRYNRNVEVPFGLWQLDTPNQIFRSILTTNTLSTTGTQFSGMDGPANFVGGTFTENQVYDLRIGHVGTDGSPWFGPPDKTGTLSGLDTADFPVPADTTAPYYVNQDNSIKVDLTGYNWANALSVIIKYYGLDSRSSILQKCRAITEAKIIVDDGSSVNEYKSLISYDRTSCASSLGVSADKLFKENVTHDFGSSTDSTASITINRIQSIVDIDNYGPGTISSNAKVSLFLKPLYYSAGIGLKRTACSQVSSSCNNTATLPSGPSTKIQSVGYFGGATRKLEADIDRQSGTLYDLFDYVIYKGS